MIEKYEFLSNLCEQIRGVSYKPFECSTIPKENHFPIYRAHNIQNDGLNDNDLVYVLQNKIADNQFIKKGDIVICASSGSKDLVGKAAQSEIDCNYSFGAFCKVVRPNKNINSKYLGFYFKSSEYRSYISSISKGSNINNLRNEDFDLIKIPFPPIEEQERIVKIIETKLTAIEKAKAASYEQIRNYDFLKNKTYEKLFEKYKNELVTIDSICNDISDGTHFTPNYVNHGIPFLSVKDLTKGYISFDDCRYIDIEEHKKLIKRCNPKYGDVLYTKVGTTGIAKAVDVEKDFSIFVSVALLKLKDNISPSFIEKSLNLPFCKKQAEKLTQGATNKNLVIKDLKTIKLFCPEYSEQLKIVKTLDNIDNSFKKLNMSLNEQSSYINALPSSILRKAFNGDY